MKNQDFLKQLQNEAKAVKALQEERVVPQELTAVADFVAIHSWQVLLFLAILASILWELFFYGGLN